MNQLTIYSKIVIVSFLMLLAGGFLQPADVSARSRESVKLKQAASREIGAPESYKNKLSKAREQILDTMTEQKNKLQNQATEERRQIEAQRTETDQETAAARAAYDASLQKVFKSLTAKADTPAKKQAVERYKRTVSSAVSARRATVDDATQTYRQGFDDLMAVKWSKVNQAVDDYVASSTSVIGQAEDDLEENEPVPSVQKYVKDHISQAENKLLKDKDLNLEQELKKIEEERAARVKQADAVLTQTLNQANKQLKAAFGGKI